MIASSFDESRVQERPEEVRRRARYNRFGRNLRNYGVHRSEERVKAKSAVLVALAVSVALAVINVVDHRPPEWQPLVIASRQ